MARRPRTALPHEAGCRPDRGGLRREQPRPASRRLRTSAARTWRPRARPAGRARTRSPWLRRSPPLLRTVDATHPFDAVEGSFVDNTTALVLGGAQQRGERLESFHQLVELGRLEALVGLRREVVGERLDPLFDGATPLAQPTVVTDQAAG